MSNISAVLVGLGYPHLRGLSPLANYQRSLVESVLEELTRRRSLDVIIETGLLDNAPVGPVDIVREADVPVEMITDLLHGQGMSRPFKRDYLALEAANRALGIAGELAVVRHEQTRLHRIGRTKLADRVEHVAQTHGDGRFLSILTAWRSGLRSRQQGMRSMCHSSSLEARLASPVLPRSITTSTACTDSDLPKGRACTGSKETWKNPASWTQFRSRRRQRVSLGIHSFEWTTLI